MCRVTRAPSKGVCPHLPPARLSAGQCRFLPGYRPGNIAFCPAVGRAISLSARLSAGLCCFPAAPHFPPALRHELSRAARRAADLKRQVSDCGRAFYIRTFCIRLFYIFAFLPVFQARTQGSQPDGGAMCSVRTGGGGDARQRGLRCGARRVGQGRRKGQIAHAGWQGDNADRIRAVVRGASRT